MGRKRNTERAIAMYALYEKGASLEIVGKAFGVTRQSVYDVFKRGGFERRAKSFLPFIKVDGIKFTIDKDGYYRRTDGDRQHLAHYVWIKHRGPIPEGMDIHHKDEDKTNNRLSNLECLSKGDHTRIHNPMQPVVEKKCVHCKSILVRRTDSKGRTETPAAVARRVYCGTKCHYAHRKGKPRNFKVKP